MEAIISMFVTDPLKAIAVCAVFLATYLIISAKKRLEKDFQGFENKLSVYERSIEFHASETRKALATHSDHMGRATKAINGDMLKIKENIFELKRELIQKVDEARAQVASIEREAKAIAHALQLTTEQFEVKFGRIIEFKKELETAHGKIIRLEEASGTFKIDIVKHREWFGQVGQTLKAHKAELDQLRAAQKKGSHEV